MIMKGLWMAHTSDGVTSCRKSEWTAERRNNDNEQHWRNKAVADWSQKCHPLGVASWICMKDVAIFHSNGHYTDSGCGRETIIMGSIIITQFSVAPLFVSVVNTLNYNAAISRSSFPDPSGLIFVPEKLRSGVEKGHAGKVTKSGSWLCSYSYLWTQKIKSTNSLLSITDGRAASRGTTVSI